MTISLLGKQPPAGRAPGASTEPVKYAGFWAGAWRRFKRSRLALYGVIFAIVISFVAVFAPVLTPYEYDKPHFAETKQPPSLEHPMGTDRLGRDMLTRIMYGARAMLLVGILTQLAGLIIGVPLGIIGGYGGGFLDWLITRLIDLFSALPWYLIVLFMVMVLSPSLQNLIIALTITAWVGTARIVRGMSFSIREQDYIEAARSLGIPTPRVLTNHMLPQIAPLLLWGFAVGIPVAVFAEASMSFIGMGVRPPQPSWGQMLNEAAADWQYTPHLFVFPSLMITLSVLAFQGMADGLREALDVNVNV
jgi:ABC-type dipeptide/oligopeptide/nickel transport system permease subunit